MGLWKTPKSHRCAGVVLFTFIAVGAGIAGVARRISRNGPPIQPAALASPVLVPVKDDHGLWGYQDATGMMRIPPRFRRAEPFSERLAAVERDSAWGFIDETGRFVINPTLYYAKSFSEGRAAVTLGGGPDGMRQAFIDRNGAIMVVPDADELRSFHDGIALACRTERIGFINREGTFVIEPQFFKASDFHDGAAAVMISKTIFGGAEDSADGRPQRRDEDHWGYVRKDGSYLVSPRFKEATDFHDGLAAVECDNGGPGYVNRSGDLAISCDLHTALDSRNGVAAALDGVVEGPEARLFRHAPPDSHGERVFRQRQRAVLRTETSDPRGLVNQAVTVTSPTSKCN